MLFKSVINLVLWAKQFYTKVFPYLCDNTVNGTQYRKNTKRFTTKIPNEMPQKYQTVYVIRKKSVTLDKICCTQK